MLTISVSEFRKLKIFRKEQKIDANYFGFRISETEIVSIYFQFRAENFQFPKFGNRKFSAGNGKLVLTISVSEFRKLKIFRKEQKIDANYFGFRMSETENIITRNGKSTRNIWVSEFLTLGGHVVLGDPYKSIYILLGPFIRNKISRDLHKTK